MAHKDDMEKDFLSCPICLEIFKEPKTLSCLHRFCEQCLNNYIKGVNTNQGCFRCPLCRELIKSPDPKKPQYQWASLFKTDFQVKDLIKFVTSKTSNSDTTRQQKIVHPCDVHADKECDIFCVDCTVAICHLCAAISHRRCHQVTSLVEAAASRRTMSDDVIKAASEKIEQASDLSQLVTKHLESIHRQKYQVQSAINERGKKLIQLVEKEIDKLSKNVDKDYDLLLDKISKRSVKFEDSQARMSEQLNVIKAKLKTASDYDLVTDVRIFEALEGLLGDDDDNSEYKKFTENLSRVKISLQESDLAAIDIGTVKMTHDAQRLNNIPLPSTKKLPAVKDESSPSHPQVGEGRERAKTSTTGKAIMKYFQRKSSSVLKPSTSPPRTEARASVSFQNQERKIAETKFQSSAPGRDRSKSIEPTGSCSSLDKPTAFKLRTINTQMRNERLVPKLKDIAVIGTNNTVLVTDWANETVKAFYTRRDLDSSLAVGGKPWAITQLTDSLVAVTLPLSQQICLIKVSPKLMIQNSIKSRKQYSGLAAMNSSTLVASGASEPPCVDIIDLHGQILKSFATDSAGLPLFVYPAYLSVTAASLILVSDRTQGAVICLSHNGEKKFKFQPSATLQNPSGTTSDRSGRIFVVESRGLLTLTPDGQFDKALVGPQDDILTDPRSVALSTDGQMLYITSNDYEVTVFAISNSF